MTPYDTVASSINESIRRHENALVMLSIQRSLQGLPQPLVIPGRWLLMRSTLWKSTRKNVQPREFFLFNDMLVYASPLVEASSATMFSRYMGAGTALSGVPDEFGLVWSRPRQGSPTEEKLGSRSRRGSHDAGEPSVALAVSLFEGQPLLFRNKFDLHDCTVVSVEEKEGVTGSPDLGGSHSMPFSSPMPGATASRHAFELRTPGKSFLIYAPTSAIKAVWLDAIRSARTDYLQAKRTLLRDGTEDESIEAKRERRRSGVPHEALRHSIARPGSMALARHRESQDIGEETRSQVLRMAAEHSSSSHSPSETPASSGEADAAQKRHSQHGAPRPMSLPPVAASSIDSIVGLFGRASIGSPPASIVSAGATPRRDRTNTVGGVSAASLAAGAGAEAWASLKVLDDYNAPVWVPDNHADRCFRCSEAFTLWRRKHHCRLCGQVVCWACSQRNFLIPTEGGSGGGGGSSSGVGAGAGAGSGGAGAGTGAGDEAEEYKVARACDTCYDSVFPSSDDLAGPSPHDSPINSRVVGPSSSSARSAVRFSVATTSSSATATTATTTTDGHEPLTPDLDEGRNSLGLAAQRSSVASSSDSEAIGPGDGGGGGGKMNHLAPSASGADLSPRSSPTRGVMQPSPRVLVEGEDAQAAALTLGASPLPSPSASSSSSSGQGQGQGQTRFFGGSKINMMLRPQVVTAGTSGTGTLRLTTPRLTTPDDEVPPSSSASASARDGTAGEEEKEEGEGEGEGDGERRELYAFSSSSASSRHSDGTMQQQVLPTPSRRPGWLSYFDHVPLLNVSEPAQPYSQSYSQSPAPSPSAAPTPARAPLDAQAGERRSNVPAHANVTVASPPPPSSLLHSPSAVPAELQLQLPSHAAAAGAAFQERYHSQRRALVDEARRGRLEHGSKPALPRPQREQGSSDVASSDGTTAHAHSSPSPSPSPPLTARPAADPSRTGTGSGGGGGVFAQQQGSPPRATAPAPAPAKRSAGANEKRRKHMSAMARLASMYDLATMQQRERQQQQQ